MKSSEPSSVLYSILAVYLPFLLLAALLSFGVSLLRSFFYFSLPAAALIIPVIFTGLAASFYFSLMKNSKSDHTAASVRGAVIIMILSYILASIFRQASSWALHFFPSPANIMAPLCALYIWVSVLSLKNLFDARELMESYTQNYRGEKLKALMLEDAPLLNTLTELSAKNRQIIIAEIIIIFVLAVIRVILEIPLSIVEFILLIMILLSAVFFFGILELFRQEHYYAGEGIAASPVDRGRRIIAMAIFSLTALGGALLLSREKSILPFSLITDFFAWLLSLLPRLAPSAPLEAPEMPDFAPMQQPPWMLEALQEAPGKPWPIWEWLRYGFIALGALLFIRFMIKPLLNRSDSGSGGLLIKLRRIIAEWFKNLRTAAADFFASLKNRDGQIKLKPDSDALRRLSEGLFAAYGQKKQRSIRGSLNLFARLIVWGNETWGLSWKPSDGPGEYCRRLSEVVSKEEGVPEMVIRCGELFEQALYAEHPLTSGEQREFKGLVEKITKRVIMPQ
ncbi:hypothetical protein AGMMS49928_12940 [Spirochaetia bacterium]|nr:hypothetical protein AGMMS49928_12940 [Spirochaetia bacterium]